MSKRNKLAVSENESSIAELESLVTSAVKTQPGVETLKSTCWECWHTCGVVLHVKDGKVIKIEGNPEHSYNRGAICPRGKNHPIEQTYHPQRFLYPMMRVGARGEGKWEKISWHEAIRIMADKFQEVREKYGPLSVAGAVSNGWFARGVAMGLLLRSMGSPNMMINCDLCGGSHWIADNVTWGDNPLRTFVSPTLSRSKCILLLGMNLPNAHPCGDLRYLQEAKKAGAKIIAVDPRRTKAAEIADFWLRIRPGTDGALLLSMIHVIIKEGIYDKDFVRRWCFGFDKLQERAEQYTPEWAAKISEIPAQTIVEVARLYALSKPATIGMMLGLQAQVNGFQTSRAATILLAISGNVDAPGGNPLRKSYPGFLTYNAILGAHKFGDIPQFQLPKEVEQRAIGTRLFPLWTGPDSIMHASHNPSVIKAILTGDPYPVKALYVSGVNILLTYPGTHETLQAFKKLDFFVAAYNTTMNPVAAYADIVLPKTTSLEEDHVAPLYYGLGLGVTQKAIAPMGEAWDDMKIAIALIDRMVEKGYIEKSFIPWKTTEEFINFQLSNTDITFEEMKRRGFIPFEYKYKEYLDKGFKTPTGKVEIYSTLLEKFGYDPLPAYVEPAQSPLSTPLLAQHYPLILQTGARHLYYHSSRCRDTQFAKRKEIHPIVEISKEAAEERGIKDGDWVWIESPYGKARIKQMARIRDDIHPKLVSSPQGWWFPDQPGPDHGMFESNINCAISYGEPWDPVVGCPSVKGLLCQVTKAQA